MPEISHQQAEALRVLGWLLSDQERDRRTGRSWILALAYLRHAVESRMTSSGPRWIPYGDHTGSIVARQLLFNYIQDLASRGGIALEANNSFRVMTDSRRELNAFREWLEHEFVASDIQLGPSIVRAITPPEPEPAPTSWERVMGED